VKDRLNKYGKISGNYAESINHYSDNPRLTVLLITINDGNKQREDRDLLFSPLFHYCGITFCEHRYYKHLFIIDYVEGYFPCDVSRNT